MYCKSLGTCTVEDEKHFLLKCPMSKELREKFLPPALPDNNMNDEGQFVQLLTNSDLQSLAKFIYMAFDNRDICLDVLSTISEVTQYVEDICLKTQNEDSVIMPYKIKNTSNRGLKLLLSRVDLVT